MDELETLQAQLTLREQELHLLKSLDTIRDASREPMMMLTDIVNLLADTFRTEACLLAVLNPTRGVLELKALNTRTEQLTQLGQILTRELSQVALRFDKAVVWTMDELQPYLSAGLELHLISLPIIKGKNEKLGVMLLARSKSPFTDLEVTLLGTAESQIDSAIVQIYAFYELQQRNRELETIYRIDRIRDQFLSFDKMLQQVLQEILNVIPCEMGFIMLYNWSRNQLDLRAATHDDLFQLSDYATAIETVADQALQQNQLVARFEPTATPGSMMCIPLVLYNVVIGVLGLVNRYGPRGFETDDQRLLEAVASQMDTAIFEGLEQVRLRNTLKRSVGEKVLQRIMDDPEMKPLKNERATVTVLFSDIRGSTQLAEVTEPDELLGFINEYLSEMTKIILQFEGTVDKFVGDEVIALFGAPFAQPDHALRAVQAALAMQAAHQRVVRKWRQRGVEATPIGIGIASGELIVGEIGNEQRSDYTVIGRVANLGSRLCDHALGSDIFISDGTYELVHKDVVAEPVTGLQLKGIQGEVEVYRVRGMD